jgi:hypothetical protein
VRETDCGPSLLSAEVAVMLDRFLDVERAKLPDGAQSTLDQCPWGTLAEAAVSRRIRIRSEQRIGEGAPDHPLDAALILEHNPQVTLTHYDRSLGHAASQRHSERLKGPRDQAAAQVRADRLSRAGRAEGAK